MKWKIGNVSIDNQVVLAPMSGVCDYAFRSIVKSMGCGLVMGEMISANAVYYGSRKTDEMLYSKDDERPLAQQVLGSDKNIIGHAARYIEENYKPEILDINMGCPVAKITNERKSGSALLKNPEKIEKIVEHVTESVDIPVTVKIRSGWDESCVNAVEISKLIERAGASAITVHPRTKRQGYSGHADWSIIREVKENVNIPVIGNGDVRSCYDAKRLLEDTDCDAVMIGRGCIGNPWLIRDCVNYLESKGEPMEVSVSEKIECIKKHAELLVKLRGEHIGILKMRKHATYYLKNIPNNKKLKEEVVKSSTKEELFKILDDYARDKLCEKMTDMK